MEDNVKDNLKKLAYLAVGFLNPEDNKFSEVVDEWVEKGKMTEEEGRKFVNEMVDKAKEIKDDIEGKFKSQSDEIIKNLHLTTTEQMAKLEKRVVDLEKKLAKKQL